MMTIRFFADLRALTGQREIAWNGSADTVTGLLKALGTRFGPAFERRVVPGGRKSETIIVLVNGRDVRDLVGADTPVGPDDVVSIFPMVAGG